MGNSPMDVRTQWTGDNPMAMGMQQNGDNARVVGAQWTGGNLSAGTVRSYLQDSMKT